MTGLYVVATGRLVSVGTAPEVVPDGMALAPLPVGATYGVSHDWDEGTAAWVVRAPDVSYTMSRGDWMARLGFERETALNMLRLNPASDLQTRATLATLESALLRRDEVDVRHAETIAGANILADVLIAIGIETTEGRAAFVAMMLAPVEAL